MYKNISFAKSKEDTKRNNVAPSLNCCFHGNTAAPSVCLFVATDVAVNYTKSSKTSMFRPRCKCNIRSSEVFCSEDWQFSYRRLCEKPVGSILKCLKMGAKIRPETSVKQLPTEAA